MEPRRVTHEGRELGNAAAAAMLCVDPDTGRAIRPETYQWYVRVGKPAGNKAPAHVWIDQDTGQRMYPLDEVRSWQAKRKGRGNWGGIGAKARHRIIGYGTCPECAETVDVDTQGRWAPHGPEDERCPKSGTPSAHYVEGPRPSDESGNLTEDDVARLDPDGESIPDDDTERDDLDDMLDEVNADPAAREAFETAARTEAPRTPIPVDTTEE